MKSFDEINQSIPYVTEGELHTVTTEVYPAVQVRSPGKYAKETNGGDFVVETRVGSKWVPYRHYDFFMDTSEKAEDDQEWVLNWYLPEYIRLLQDDTVYPIAEDFSGIPGVHPTTMLQTLQVIAVAEFRRYPKAEPLGGRYLLLRFLTGIACGLWDAKLAASYLKQGKVGLKKLRHKTGLTEPTTSEILKGIEIG